MNPTDQELIDFLLSDISQKTTQAVARLSELITENEKLKLEVKRLNRTGLLEVILTEVQDKGLAKDNQIIIDAIISLEVKV